MGQAERTRSDIINTYWKLSMQKSGKVNVSEICNALGIYRSTFYNYFSDINELSEAACNHVVNENMLDEVSDRVRILRFEEILILLATHALHNRAQILVLTSKHSNSQMKAHYYDITRKDIKKIFGLGNSLEDRIMLDLLVEGLIAALHTWLESNSSDVELFVNTVANLCTPFITNRKA